MTDYERLLYKSFDGKLTPTERILLDEQLSKNKRLSQQKKEIEFLRSQIKLLQQPPTEIRSTDEIYTRILNEKHEQVETQYYYFKRVSMVASIMGILILSAFQFSDFSDETYLVNEIETSITESIMGDE